MNKNNLVLVNANVITMDDDCPHATSVAIHDGKIFSLNKENIAGAKSGTAAVIDCRGKTVLPAFIDAHCHFVGLAESLIVPNIGPDNVASISDIQNIIRKAARVTPPGKWIRGRGYNIFHIKEKRHPNRWDIDQATSQHPVSLMHSTGYVQVLNSMGLKEAKISFNTEAPADGVIERDLDSGEPNGILYNMGSYLNTTITPIEEEHMKKAIKMASEHMISLGIASIHEASRNNDIKRWNLLRKCVDSNMLKARVTMALGWQAFQKGQDKDMLKQDDHICLDGVKIILTEASGELHPSPAGLKEKLGKIHRSGKQAVIHAIEDHVIAAAADALEAVLAENPRKDHRHRIEHCSVCPPKLARRLAALAITVVTQPNFVYYNGERYLKTVPREQMPYLYPFGTLIKAGLNVAASSDCPVVPADPLKGIYSAVTRKTSGGNLLNRAERISVADAIRMYTINAARALFEEDRKGSITPGKLADIVILNQDPLKVDPEKLEDLKIDMVIIGGEVVYEG